MANLEGNPDRSFQAWEHTLLKPTAAPFSFTEREFIQNQEKNVCQPSVPVHVPKCEEHVATDKSDKLLDVRAETRKLKRMGNILNQYVQLSLNSRGTKQKGDTEVKQAEPACNVAEPHELAPGPNETKNSEAKITVKHRKMMAEVASIQRQHKAVFLRGGKQFSPRFLLTQKKWEYAVQEADQEGQQYHAKDGTVPLNVYQNSNKDDFVLGVLATDPLVKFKTKHNKPKPIVTKAAPRPRQIEFEKKFGVCPEIDGERSRDIVPRPPKMTSRHRRPPFLSYDRGHKHIFITEADTHPPNRQHVRGKEKEAPATVTKCISFEESLRGKKTTEERALLITDRVLERLINVRRNQLADQPTAFKVDEIKSEIEQVQGPEKAHIRVEMGSYLLKKKLVNKFVRKVKHKAKKQALLSIYGERSKLYRSEYNKICKDAQEYFRSASTPKEPESKVSASNLREEAAAALKPNMLKTIDSLHTTKQHGKLQLSDALHKTALHLVHAGDETTLYAVMSLSPGTLRKFLRFKKHLEDEEEKMVTRREEIMKIFIP
jgi:hypothetical protein